MQTFRRTANTGIEINTERSDKPETALGCARAAVRFPQIGSGGASPSHLPSTIHNLPLSGFRAPVSGFAKG